jgi:hypothetical protein
MVKIQLNLNNRAFLVLASVIISVAILVAVYASSAAEWQEKPQYHSADSVKVKIGEKFYDLQSAIDRNFIMTDAPDSACRDLVDLDFTKPTGKVADITLPDFCLGDNNICELNWKVYVGTATANTLSRAFKITYSQTAENSWSASGTYIYPAGTSTSSGTNGDGIRNNIFYGYNSQLYDDLSGDSDSSTIVYWKSNIRYAATLSACPVGNAAD